MFIKVKKCAGACCGMTAAHLQHSSPKLLKGDCYKGKEIPENIINIDDGCFRSDGRMREVILPPNCKIIGREAFFQCQIRKEVVLPKTMKEIKRRAFSENHSCVQSIFQRL